MLRPLASRQFDSQSDRQDGDAIIAASAHSSEALGTVSAADENRLMVKVAVRDIFEFYRHVWLIIGAIVPMCFAIYATWSHIIPNYLCIDQIKVASVSCQLPTCVCPVHSTLTRTRTDS
jgi:hypothetical protein